MAPFLVNWSDQLTERKDRKGWGMSRGGGHDDPILNGKTCPSLTPSLRAAGEAIHSEMGRLLHFVRNDEEGMKAGGAGPETE